MIDRPRLALGLMTLSALGFTIMAVFVKKVSDTIPQYEIVFFRCWVNALIVGFLMLRAREPFFPSARWLLVARGVAGFFSLSCLIYSLRHLPISIASLLSGCTPIFVILFSAWFLGERLARGAFVWTGLALAGLVLILRPDFNSGVTAIPPWAMAVGISGAAFAALALIAVRSLTARVGNNAIIFYFTGLATLISLPIAVWDGWVWPTPIQWVELISMGAFATLGQVTMTQAYRFAAAGLVSVMGLSTVGFSALFGWALFGELLGPIQWAGMVFLASGIALITLSHYTKAGKKSSATSAGCQNVV